jgi:NAD(P)-dependent dehydrogenase (short-subunit alcohol dehydrogenase family)
MNGQRLAGRKALITGAGSGIGAATALRFAREGAAVMLVDANAASLQATQVAIQAACPGSKLQVLAADVSHAESAREAVRLARSRGAGVQVKVPQGRISARMPSLRPSRSTWIFTGSIIDESGFAADQTGSIISTYVDRLAVINSSAKGNHRDDLWISMPVNIPTEETAVTLIITPAKE